MQFFSDHSILDITDRIIIMIIEANDLNEFSDNL